MAVRDVVQAAAGVGGDKLYVEDVFSTYLYTGTATTLNIENNIDLAGEGGLTWIKSRSSGTLIHVLHDTERGAPERLNTASTDAQATMPAGVGVTSFNSNGFTLGTGTNYNASGGSYASWTWRKAPKFFDVVTGTTGSDTNYRISHNLGSVPGCIIFKRTDAASTWIIWHRSLSSTTDSRLQLGYNATLGEQTRTNTWGTSGPTDTDFGIDTTYFGAGIPFAAYVFAHDAGGFGDDGEQNVISCGSYTGTGATQDINLGWETQFLLVKKTNSTGDWYLYDVMRGMAVTGDHRRLAANLSDMEYSLTAGPRPIASGFQLDASSNINTSGSTYIYIAIRRPMKTPESGTEVFGAVARTGTGVATTVESGVLNDLAIIKNRGSGVEPALWANRLTGPYYMKSASTNAETSSTTAVIPANPWDLMGGMRVGSTSAATNASGSNFINYHFRRAPSFMDVVAYTGTGVAHAEPHNLGVAPEMMIVKTRSTAENWIVYHSALTATSYLNLNTDGIGGTTSIAWDNTEPTATNFTVGLWNNVNGSGVTNIAYLFATLPGVSKVGSYTGTGTAQTIDCGFSSGARFVLIKRTDSTGDWYVWDSVRGIVAGNDPYFFLNSGAAEVTSTDYIDPVASGFEISSSAPAAINASGGTFIYLAIA